MSSTMQGFVWDCSTEQEPTACTFPQGASVQAVALAAHSFSLRGAPPTVSALCVYPNVVLVGMPALKRGRVLFVGAPGAAVGDDPARLFALAPAALSQPLCASTFRAFLDRLGVGKRLTSLPRCSAVDAVFAIRIEQFSPTQPQATESDDESYQDVDEPESSGASIEQQTDSEN
jgi:hypothetical protein